MYKSCSRWGSAWVPVASTFPSGIRLLAAWAFLLTSNRRLSVPVFALQKEGGLSGPGQRPGVTQCQPWPLWLTLDAVLGGQH